jgi:hypothetical protein
MPFSSSSTAPSHIVYALSPLSTVFPKSLTKNVAFRFTNPSNHHLGNFRPDTVPVLLKGAPQFLIDYPVALQMKYLRLKNDPGMKSRRVGMRKEVTALSGTLWVSS